MAFIAAFAGGLVITFLVSRLVRVLFKSRPDPGRSLIAAGVTLVVAVVLGGFGFADGGAPKFGSSLALYLPAVLVWLAVDVLRARKAKTPVP